MRLLPILALLLPPAFVAAALHWGHDPIAQQAQAPLIDRAHGFVGSATCAQCHPDHHASWRATFHSTMTQLPAANTVRGTFDGRIVRYGKDAARPFREGERFCIEVQDSKTGKRTAEVALLVGSRRYQQYFERQQRGDGFQFVRLPILWHIEHERWLPLETVFLGPDMDGLGHHAAEWNNNCVLCHNTGARPGLLDINDAARQREGNRYDSKVGELGIACEACHGPGEQHSTQQRDPLTRLAGGGKTQPSANKLDQERAVAVCGQCHGARLPEPLQNVQAWFTTGPTFRVGDRLTEHVLPIVADTPVRGGADPEVFKLRFWGDGTPRLTAYEYQGVVASTCYQKGALTCQSCHAMHAGDPRGQLRPDRLGNAMCTQCHPAIAADVLAHTHHAADSAGSQCVNCHMPRIVYGVLDIHRSHRIDSPDPARDAAAGRPHACSLCHVDQTPAWVARSMRTWWGKHYVDPQRRADGAPLQHGDAMATLFAGDAAARAVVANALGRPEAVFGKDHAAAVRSWLAVTIGDGYPSVRFQALRSLRALEARSPWGLGDGLARLDHTAGAEVRGKDQVGLLGAIARAAATHAAPPASTALLGRDFRLDVAGVVKLTDLQGRNLIAIGE